MIDLTNKKVTVMGLGLHGGALGTVLWLASQGAKLTVTDIKTKTELEPTLKKLEHLKDITYVLGGHHDEDFTKADLVIRNPGVRRNSPYLQLAASKNIPIEMDSSLFFQACPSKHIIGITGSKGKSTTTKAIAHVLGALYPKLALVGFDQSSPLGQLPDVTSETRIVFELSSWRLEALMPHKISPATAIITSIYRDHLNTYNSLEEYIETKKTIIRYQQPTDRALLNADDIKLRQWEKDVTGQLFWYSLEESIPGHGICVQKGIITAVLANGTHSLFPLKEILLQQPHSRRNLLPAVLLAYLDGLPVNRIQELVHSFTGLPHRLEKVRILNDVTYINDSTATMPDATIAALASLAGQPIVHILGGSDKDLLFEDLATAESKANIRALIFLPGTATERMRKALNASLDIKPPMLDASSMEEAVKKASELAQPGDNVLMSPGATSFGLFLHEFDRGDRFVNAVKNLS